MSTKKFHVAYITDENYAMPTCVSIVSLIANKADDVSYTVHIITDNVSDQTKENFKKLNTSSCKIDIIDADSSSYQDIKDDISKRVNLHVTLAALLKFNLSNILKDLDTVLYIDGDTIICKDISELFEVNMSKYYVAAVENPEANYFPNLSNYFNSGVMLFNLKKMRLDNMTEKLIDYRKNRINYFMDQDALNVVLSKKTLFLPLKYNFRIPFFISMEFSDFNEKYFSSKYADEYECIQDQKILHTTVALKPWKYFLPWVGDMFLKYYRMSPYKNKNLKLKSPLPVIIEQTQKSYEEMYKKKEWRFPREKIPKGSKVILYGAGDVGNTFWNFLQDTNYAEVVLWVDKKCDSDGISIHARGGGIICPPKNIINCKQYDYVLISIVCRHEIVKIVSSYLEDLGVPKDKIITLF